MQRLHIFRPGRHTAADGRAIEFTAADLAASARAYDPALHEAPLVVGHPRENAPAYGWVGSLMCGEEGLDALPHQVDPAFAEMVATGRYKKVSASFYLPDAPANPVKGVYYLRHVGFLGAQPPAVKGLRPVAFAETEEGVIEFSDWAARENASLWRRLREWLIAQFGLEAADRVAPEYALQSLAPEPEAPDPAAVYSESVAKENAMSADDQARLAALEAENAQLHAAAAALAEREARIAAAEADARRREIAEFVEGLAAAGKILPREQAGLIAFMDALAGDGVIEFEEGAERRRMAVPDWFRAWLDSLPARVDYSERAAAGGEEDAIAFAAPAGYSVDVAGLERHRRALGYQKAHPGTDYLAAVAAVNEGA